MKRRLAESWEELDKELQRIENYLKEVGEQLKKRWNNMKTKSSLFKKLDYKTLILQQTIEWSCWKQNENNNNTD